MATAWLDVIVKYTHIDVSCGIPRHTYYAILDECSRTPILLGKEPVCSILSLGRILQNAIVVRKAWQRDCISMTVVYGRHLALCQR